MSNPVFTLCVFSENSPGVLQRITVLFTRRKLNIESLTVSETERRGVSRFTMVVKAERDVVEKVAKQIQRIVEVSDVLVCENEDLIFSEIAFYKVSSGSADQKRKIEEIAAQSAAEVTEIKGGALVIEKSGSEQEVGALFKLLEPFGIREFVRSGRIAILKEPRTEEEWNTPRIATGDVEKNSLI